MPSASPPELSWRYAGFIKPAAIRPSEPPSVLSPFAQLRCYLRWGDVSAISSAGVTPPSSLLRAHVPLPLGSLLLRHLASFEESWQVVRSPCCPPGGSRRYLRKSFLGCWIPYPGGIPCALTCFFHDVIGLPQEKNGSASRVLSHELRLLAGPVFRGCRYSLMFRPPSLLSPQIVPTAAHTAAGQPGILRPGLSCFVASTRTGYANRPNTGN